MTENGQRAYLFFQMLTMTLSMACALIGATLLFYVHFRPSPSFADSFADSVRMNVRITFFLVVISHISYCCALALIGFVYFPHEVFALGLCVAVFTALLL
jgi:hypothetical protein